MSGLLILAANSLGCDEDIPRRALEHLRSSDLVVFEEDRTARSCLKAAGIHRNYLIYSEHQETEALENIQTAFKQNQTVTYMSNQGSPTLADPGHALVKLAYQYGAALKVIPGPSAITAALTACPFDTKKFLFADFLPKDQPGREHELKNLTRQSAPIVILETPYRLQALLESCVQVLGPRRIFLALDISGPLETYLWGTSQEVLQKVTAIKEKINFVLVIEGEKQQRHDTHAKSVTKTFRTSKKNHSRRR